MNKGRKWGVPVFVLVMLIFVFFMGAYPILRSGLDFTLEDTARSLETSRGRERKQQHEYDEVVAELPLVRAELEETAPKAEAAQETVKQLKEERKKLRERKKELTEKAKSAENEAGAAGTGAE